MQGAQTVKLGPESLVFASRRGTPLRPERIVKQENHPACSRVKTAHVAWHTSSHTHATPLNRNFRFGRLGSHIVRFSCPRHTNLPREQAPARLERLRRLVLPVWQEPFPGPSPVKSSPKKVAAKLFILQGSAKPLSSVLVWAEPSHLLIGIRPVSDTCNHSLPPTIN